MAAGVMKSFVVCYLSLAIWVIVMSPVQSSTINVNATQDVKISASPDSIHEGFTENMMVNCTFPHDAKSDFSTVMSLILSKTFNNEDTYRELAAITSVSRDKVEVKNSLGAQVTGQLYANHDSFISLTWSYPTSQVVGVFKCEAFGMDHTGHPRVSSAVAEVSERDIDISMVIERMKEISLLLKDHSSVIKSQKMQLEMQKTTNDEQKRELGVLKTQLGVHKSKLDDLTSRLSSSLSAFMVDSVEFRGHRYYLSRPIWWNIVIADNQCRMYGGYLATISDQDEFNAVTGLMRKHHVNQYTAINGTDAVQEGTWKYMNSDVSIPYLNWSSGNPDTGTRGNCLGIDTSFKMNDIWCTHHDHLYRFICEIPI